MGVPFKPLLSPFCTLRRTLLMLSYRSERLPFDWLCSELFRKSRNNKQQEQKPLTTDMNRDLLSSQSLNTCASDLKMTSLKQKSCPQVFQGQQLTAKVVTQELNTRW
ncbi:hypothetical protein TNCV_4273041 [Trichonephila clavipes]|nr:hypothetical protein TNCV_4273041 [Trichonephila clavipes]